MADCGTCTKQRGTYIPDFVNAPPNQMAQKSDEIKKKRKHEWGRRDPRLLKNTREMWLLKKSRRETRRSKFAAVKRRSR